MNAYIESEQPPRVTREKAEAPLEKAAAAKESERIRLAAFAMSRSSSFHDRRHLRFSITSRWTVLRLPGDRTI